MYDPATLQATLKGYCKWQTIPRQLFLDAIKIWNRKLNMDAISNHPSDEAVQEQFLQALGLTVSLEWTVCHHYAFSIADSSMHSDQGRSKHQSQPQQQQQRQQATIYAQAIGTPHGIMCFGGMELGKLQQIKVKSEVSWIKEHNGLMLQPDFSRVYQSTSSHHSKQVFRLSPDDTGSSWSAKPCSPALSVGLIGHSAVLYGSRVFIFGGLEMSVMAADANADDGRRPTQTSSKVRAYAVDEAGTQGGMLPVLSDMPQMGPQPSSRMYHTAAVDPEAGVMYVYGGVHMRDFDGSRWPADKEPGTIHCYNFHTYTWSTMSTTGQCRPCCTTLLAFCWHDGALWAIPDVPANSGSSRSRSSQAHSSGYKLLRLDVASTCWQEVTTQGTPPCLRTDSCSLYHNGQILIYGGRTAGTPASMLSDLHLLDLNQQQPVWSQVQPRLAASSSNSKEVPSNNSSNAAQRQPLLSLAGHCGGVDKLGNFVFWGGYRRIDLKEPQSVIQVLRQRVKAPTADAAQLSSDVASDLALALQHVRQQLARLVRQHYPKQVLLRPDGGGGVRLPVRLLALYSTLFDDIFQEMLEDEEQDTQTPVEPQVVPVPGASLQGVAGVCRWMMGLLALGSCSMEMLIDMYRVADQLIMEQLMVEILDVLSRKSMTPQQAAALLQLTGGLSGRDDMDGLNSRAAQQLNQQVTPVTAPGIMALALQINNKQLQDRCCDVMLGHRKNDVWAVLEFACRFNLPRMQGSCLHFLSQLSRGRLVDHAERIVKVAKRFAQPGRPLISLPAVQMLEKDLCLELSLLEGNITALTSYAAAAGRLQLQKVRQGLIDCCSSLERWRQLQEQKQVLQHIQQRYPDLAQAISQRVRAR